jgi:DNA-binding Lrp family transcriptional regulator
MSELSELEAAILRELQNNARRTNRAIAEAVHVAPSTSLERIRSLRERGVIRGYHAEANLAALGREVQALIAIRIRPPSRENIEAFRDWAHQLPETVGVFVVSGTRSWSTASPNARRSATSTPPSSTSTSATSSSNRSDAAGHE